MKGQKDGTSGASAAYYSIDQRSKGGGRNELINLWLERAVYIQKNLRD